MLHLLGLGINTSASIIWTVHIYLLHRELIVKDGKVVDDRAVPEEVLMFIVISLYFASFVLFILSAFLEQTRKRKVWYLVEKHFGVDFNDVHGVSMDDVEDFEEEKRRGFTIKKAKDTLRTVHFETHTRPHEVIEH